VIDDAETIRRLAAIASDPQANPNEAGNAERKVFTLLRTKGLKLEDVFRSGLSEEEAKRREDVAYQRGLHDGEQKALGDVHRQLASLDDDEGPLMAPKPAPLCRRCWTSPCRCRPFGFG
jgi:hypothetical protein